MSYEPIFDALRETRFPLVNGSGDMPAVGFGTLFKDLGVTVSELTPDLIQGFGGF